MDLSSFDLHEIIRKMKIEIEIGDHWSWIAFEGVISDNRRVWRNGKLFSQADGDMIFVLSMVFMSVDPEGHCTWKEAEAQP